MHASERVALAGPSGAGKSTLAAVVSTRGCAVLAGDICIVDPAEDEVLSFLARDEADIRFDGEQGNHFVIGRQADEIDVVATRRNRVFAMTERA